jgi:hypothetical protein
MPTFAITLIGPEGAGKSTVAALIAERLGVTFVDLDRSFADRAGDISEYINRFGYDAYARENVETYRAVLQERRDLCVGALLSGFMTYRQDIHPEYVRLRRDVRQQRKKQGFESGFESTSVLRFRRSRRCNLSNSSLMRSSRRIGCHELATRSSLTSQSSEGWRRGGIRSRRSRSYQRLRPIGSARNGQIHSKPEYQAQNRYSARCRVHDALGAARCRA